MKRKILTLLIILMLIPAVAYAEETVNVKVTGICDYDSAYAVMDIVNEERAKVGLQPLSMNESLLEAAMQRAAEIALSYGHERPDGNSCLTAIDIDARVRGENIAAGQNGPAEVMTAWMNSDGHRENILRSSFNTIGVGCFYQEEVGIRSWVQLFTSSTDGGYVTDGEEANTFDIYALTEKFDEPVCYNPSLSEYYGLASFTYLCPGQTEEFRVMEQNYVAPCIIEEENYTLKAATDNIKIDGRNVTVLSEGEAVIDIYISGIKVGSHKFIAEHEFGNNTSGKPATCTQDGYKNGRSCRFCGYMSDESGIIPALGHDWLKNVKAPTCENHGYDYYICQRCYEGYEDENSFVPALGHDWVNMAVNEDSFVVTKYCRRCHKTQTVKDYGIIDTKMEEILSMPLARSLEGQVMKLKAAYDTLTDEEKLSIGYKDELLEYVEAFELYHMGDVDFDGVIGAYDLSELLGEFSHLNDICDISGDDHIINSDDLSMILSNYGKRR